MTPPPLLLLVPLFVAVAVAIRSAHGQHFSWRLVLPVQGLLAVVLVQSLRTTGSTALQTSFASLVWLGVTACLWRTRHHPLDDGSSRAPAALFGLQGGLWLCALAPHATGVLMGFCAAGLCLQALTQADDARKAQVYRFHRTADAFAIAAVLVWLLWSPELIVNQVASAQASDEAVLSPIAGFTAATWLLGLLSVAMLMRSWGAALACAAEPTSLLVVVIGLAGSTFGFARLFTARNVAVLVSASLAGVILARTLPRLTVLRRVAARLLEAARSVGRFIAGINQWVFSTILLQAPVVAVDACARLLKLLAGGDIQRYVAIGVAGLSALVFITTRPASRAVLEIEADGLTIHAAAAKGSLSSARLLYDYDFDGDGQFDRVGVGPRAAFVYAAPGTYAVSVTIRDPFWHTSKTLRAKIKVGR